MAADYDVAVCDHRVDLLEIDGVLAGLIETIDEPGQLLIENVAVSPEFQGRGFGRQLMDHAEALAVTNGYAQTRLYTNKAFAENVRLYLSLGYEVTSEEPHGDGFAVYMHKVITDR